MKNLAIPALASMVLLTACGSSPSGSGTGLGTCPASAETQDLPGLPGAPTGGGGLTAVTSFGANPGALKMYVHAPKGGTAAAVVVAMHGCTQGASDYTAAGWNELADKAGFAVVYPEQTSSNNSQRCFRWFDKAQTTREGSEAKSIAAMTEYAMKQYGATKAYVTGLSAGAAMTSVMLATYPELFEAGAIMAGLPYACATSQSDAYSCMSPGRDKTPAAWADLVPAATRSAPPRVSIWHGDADWIVRPANETQLVRQWTAVAGVGAEPATTATEGLATHEEYKDDAGVVRVESWLVKGMGHGVALSPKDGCGKAGAYLLDEGICSTTKAAVFFGLVAADGTPTPGSTNPAGSSSGGASSGGPKSPGDCN
ncbi:MAG TPA: PHB depolymerase family esterase [Labilithrix sp.]|nr:PHB depolymerase family esterase [Labilithrix sp.]